MADVLIFDKSISDIGLKVRHATEAPEDILLHDFLEKCIEKYEKRKKKLCYFS